MLCLIFNIHNPLNYDVGFPHLDKDKLPFPGALPHSKQVYHPYNKERKEIGPEKEITLYKVRLCGLVKKSRDYQSQRPVSERLERNSNTNRRIVHTEPPVRKQESSPRESEGFVKHRLIQWNNRTGGVFYIRIKSLDRFGRIEADLIDPVSGQSLADWLARKYPDHYRPYVK